MADDRFDLSRARAETPGVSNVVHLNNAGAALMPQAVTDAMMDYLQLESQIGAYEAAERSQEKIDYAHEALARLINCHHQELAILDSASRAWGLALSSIPLQAGDRIIISAMEYGSNYISLLHLSRRLGVSVEVLPANADGLADVAELEGRLDERVRLIALPHVPMHDGLVNPVAEFGKVARRHGIPFMVDACQSVGQLPVDVVAIGCDLLVGSGRKFLRGPRGTGFLYVRQEIAHKLTPAVLGLDGVEWLSGTYRIASGARRFETWEMNCASRIGLGVAAGYALDWGVEHTWLRLRQLADSLRKDLARLPSVRVQDRGRERCGIIALTFDEHDGHWVRAKLQRAGINTWVCLENAACLDMQMRGLRSLLRISPHYYNSPDELARFCSVLEETLAVGQPAWSARS
jgi:selenocysteine lyase/cysteine desulfurase